VITRRTIKVKGDINAKGWPRGTNNNSTKTRAKQYHRKTKFDMVTQKDERCLNSTIFTL
jgi:hypothetical protein